MSWLVIISISSIERKGNHDSLSAQVTKREASSKKGFSLDKNIVVLTRDVV
jgi:hypothetical protein